MMSDKDMKRRVVITGIGLVTPVGHDVETTWDALLKGKSGVAETTLFDASTFPTKFGAEVKNYDPAKFVRDMSRHKNAGRGSSFALGAAVQACRQAGIDIETDDPSDGIDRRRLGVYLGAGEGAMDADAFFNSIGQAWDDCKREMDWSKWAQESFAAMRPAFEMEQEPSMSAAHVARLTGARGASRSCLTACAASTQAVGEAMVMVRSGWADVMITGGSHSMIHPMGVTGFNRLTALSTRNDSPETASRPFSATRDGFVLGEGAAILVLEELESAKKRGANILAEITGYGSSSDAFRVTDMHDQGRGATQAIRYALEDAGITEDQIDYISAHGTSTSENDSVETKAIKAALGEKAAGVPVSSTKSVMGHLIGATGAAELITCVLAIRDGVLPPTINLNDPDPELDLDYVPNEPRKKEVNIAMKESFGFGGQNNVIVIKKYS